MLKSLVLENFTVFPSAHFDFSPGINAFVGENGTGKTHLLKVAYCQSFQALSHYRGTGQCTVKISTNCQGG